MPIGTHSIRIWRRVAKLFRDNPKVGILASPPTIESIQKCHATTTIIKTSQQYQQSSFSIRQLFTTLATEHLHRRTRTMTTPAASSMLLRGTPASLCGRYAAESPPRRACCSAARQHHFADATPTKLRCAEHVRSAAPRITLRTLRVRLSAASSMLLCCLAGSGLVLYALVPPPMTYTFYAMRKSFQSLFCAL